MREKRPFTSRMSRGEAIAALVWLPVHVLLLPLAMELLLPAMDDASKNLWVYGIGTVYMLALCWRFLRRDFDPLCDRPGRFVLEVAASYGLMLLCNFALAVLLLLFGYLAGTEESILDLTENPNNIAVAGLASLDYGRITAMAVILAPIVEELIFRGAVFGMLRQKNRALAYVLGMLLFSLYHVWSYALADPIYWLYLIQYLPVSFLLCRCYERTDSIWGSIFFHMLVNAISMRSLLLLEEMMAVWIPIP